MCISCLGGLCLTGSAAGGEETWKTTIYKNVGLDTPFRPSDNYVSSQNAPDFMWPYVEGARSYDLIICSDKELKDVKYRKDGLTKNFYTFPHTFETGVHYYWAVRYNDGSGASEWSNPRRFRIDPDAYEFVKPETSELLARVPKTHPRLYTQPDKLEEFRSYKDTNEYCKKVYDKIMSWARGYLESGELPKEAEWSESSDATEQSEISQAVRSGYEKAWREALICAYAYMLSGDAELGRVGVESLKIIASWDINGGSSFEKQDQIARSICYESAIAYDMLYDLMTEDEKDAVVSMIKARMKVMEKYLVNIEKSAYDSHGWTIYGYMGITALALYGDIPEAEEWLSLVLNAYVSLMHPWSYQDGGWSQGPGYWQWSSAAGYEFTEVLALSGVIDLHQKAWAKNQTNWMLYTYPPGGYETFGNSNKVKSSADCSGNIAGRQLAFEQDNRILKWLFEEWDGLEGQLSIRDLIITYYVASRVNDIEPELPIDKPLAHEFDDIGWIVMTDDLVSQERIHATFKSSHFGSYNHSEADQNSFFIQAYGELLAIKSGYYDAYHTPHNSGFARKTGAHNSVTLATNRGQKDDDFNAKGKLTGFLNQVDFDLAAGDATQAYKSDSAIDKFERCMIYIRPDIFVVVDELDARADTEEKFEWWLNAANDMQVYDEGNGCRICENNAVMDATLQYPRDAKTYYNNTFALSDMKEYPAGGSYSSKPVDRRVWFETPKVKRTKMVVTMDVHRKGNEARYIDTEYHDDYVKMTFEDGTIVLVNLLEPGTLVTTEEGISFDGAAVTYNDESIMLALGTSLKWGDTQLIQCEKRASVVMGKDELGISSYTDQRISVNTNNDYIKGINKVTNYDGKEISKGYGITMESGMLVSTGEAAADNTEEKPEAKTETAPVRKVQNIRGRATGIPISEPQIVPSENESVSAETNEPGMVYEIKPSDDAVTFTLDRDNYTLMLNGKNVESVTVDGTCKITIKDEGTTEVPISGYTTRDGSMKFSGTTKLDGNKYKVVSISDGFSFGGMIAGEARGISDVTLTSSEQNNEVVLERVPVLPMEVSQVDDHESLKESAAVFMEAENAKTIGSGRIYNTRKFMSGGAGITEHNTPGTLLTYELEVPEDGDYQMAMKYVSWKDGGAAKRSVGINGKVYTIDFPLTAGWGSEPEEWRAVTSNETIHLTAGTHTVNIEAVSGMWNLDWIALIKK